MEKASSLLLRYAIMILSAVFFKFFYVFMLPLTIYPLYFFLGLLYPVSLNQNTLFVAGKGIEIIKACVGGSAVFLLFILNISTPNIKLKKRAVLFSATLLLFLLFNWVRIFALSLFFIKDFFLFDQIHVFSWYFVSIIAVVAIWFFSVKLFAVKDAPFLTDLFQLYKLSKKKEKKR